jgi:DNA polymerase-3 subunit alpha|tara:strand:- start:12198 stop:15452 length:3255 start_codon:yes stop_codon:yes gene_type:complete
MKLAPFVSLHNHTELGSPLDGMNDVNKLFDQAKELNHRAIAITDHGTLTAHYDAWKASVRTGVKLIPGIEAYFADSLDERKTNHLVLLAQNEIGYKNILRLNYESYKNQISGYMGKRTPRISWEHLKNFNEGVVCLTACSNGVLSKAIIADGDIDLAVDRMVRFKSIFGDRFFLEIQPHSLKTDDGKVDQQRLNETLISLSRDYGIDYVATCDAHYLDKEHAKYHDMMLAIKDKKAFDDPDRFRYGVQDMYLKSHEELMDFFGRDIGTKAMKTSVDISDSCQDASYIKPKGPMLPSYPVSMEGDYSSFREWHSLNSSSVPEDKAYLRFRCIKGFKEKFKDISSEKRDLYWSRVKKELGVLEEKDFSSYMLIVSDYTSWAKDSGIPVGPARGSAAGSLVAYLTNITSVDPMKHDLIFERFHNSQKKSFPDIDTDFSDPSRVKQYLKDKYGEDKVASISNWSTLSPKVIIKDVARSLRIGGDKSSAFKIANHITSIMPDTSTIEQAMMISEEFAAYMHKYPELYKNSIKLQGLTRNWSVHAAGVVISDEPLYEKIPLRIDADGMLVTQWEKTRCEDNGLIKMDLLGLKTLTVMDEVLSLIDETSGVKISMDDIPMDDKKTFEMISKGNTVGVFQLESSLTPLCIKIKPGDVSMVADINALGRPSCSPDDRRKYIKRRFGLESPEYIHENLKGALSSTHGVSLYEEGMMTIAKDCAGWNYDQADALRKITKLKGKDPDLVLKTEANFIKDCIKHSDISYSKAKQIWDKEIIPFGQYGFNKSHSISYSYISVQTAWLKCNYPTQFMCALINSEDPNSDKAQEYLSECRSMKIDISPPDVNVSKGQYSIEKDRNIATGISAIKGVGDKAVSEIIENQPYKDFSDFLRRNNSRVVGKTAIQSLAKSGALDCFKRTRKDIHDNYQKYRTKIRAAEKKEKFIDDSTLPEYNDEWSRKDILLYEKQVLGRSISGSLHEAFSAFFGNSYNKTPLSSVPMLESGSRVRVEAIINSKIKEFKIKNGKRAGRKFAKYLIEDSDGNTCGLTVWADDYERYKAVLKDGIPIKAICKVSEYLDQKDLALSTLERVYGRTI